MSADAGDWPSTESHSNARDGARASVGSNRRANAGPVRVLYIAGWQRSGSTLIANLLGELPGYFHAGELYYLWDYVWHDDTLCGCGRRFHVCPLWQEIIGTAYPGGVDADWMYEQAVTSAKTKRMAGLAWGPARRRSLERTREYRRNLDDLYRAIAHLTGASVVVDSSKWPSYGLLLGSSATIDLSVIHLVRDPRAVAHSWLRKKRLLDRPERHVDMYRSPVGSSARWLVWNLATEAYWRSRGASYVRLRYEDFVAEPEQQLQRALDRLGLPAGRLPFISSHRAQLGPNHTVSGNPDRLQHGATVIKPDEEWRQLLARQHRLAVSALTFPLMLKYRYLVRRRRSLPRPEG